MDILLNVKDCIKRGIKNGKKSYLSSFVGKAEHVLCFNAKARHKVSFMNRDEMAGVESLKNGVKKTHISTI